MKRILIKRERRRKRLKVDERALNSHEVSQHGPLSSLITEAIFIASAESWEGEVLFIGCCQQPSNSFCSRVSEMCVKYYSRKGVLRYRAKTLTRSKVRD